MAGVAHEFMEVAGMGSDEAWLLDEDLRRVTNRMPHILHWRHRVIGDDVRIWAESNGEWTTGIIEVSAEDVGAFVLGMQAVVDALFHYSEDVKAALSPCTAEDCDDDRADRIIEEVERVYGLSTWSVSARAQWDLVRFLAEDDGE